MAYEIVALSVTDGSNNSAAPNGWPENMARSDVNNSARALMGALARFEKDTNGSLNSAGGTTAYTLAANRTTAVAVQGEVFVFKINATNTGATTINITPSGGAARGAVAVQKAGAALAAGDWTAGDFACIRFDGTQYQSVTGVGVTLAANMAAFLATPSSANLRAAVTDESGTGALLFAGGALGTPASGVVTNLTGAFAAAITFSAGIIFANETLQTYDEGTHTPGISFGGAAVSITYTSQLGAYTKIGNVVAVDNSIVLSNKGSSVGAAKVTGMPFTAKNDAVSRPLAVSTTSLLDLNVAGGYYAAAVRVLANTTTIEIEELGDNVATADLDNTDFSNTSVLLCGGTYHATTS